MASKYLRMFALFGRLTLNSKIVENRMAVSVKNKWEKTGMDGATQTGLDASQKTLGHLALHYRTPDDAPRAAKLLELLGMNRLQEIPFGGGMVFYQFTVAEDHSGRGIGTLYLSLVPQPLAELTQVIRGLLKIGTPEEHPAVAAAREVQNADPEANFHVGLMVNSLEEIERLMLLLGEANESDPDLKGRLKLVTNKARAGGDAGIEARMQGSPVFSRTERSTYGLYGCQAFIETDLLVGGPLGENMVIELDYVFPGHPDHLFVKTGV